MQIDRTKEYYISKADDYFRETSYRDLKPYWSIFESNVKAGSLILDLGCGSGRDLKHFAAAGHRSVGIDYALPLLKLASRFSGQSTVLGDLRNLPFQAASFDAAWAMASLLHHPRETVTQTLVQILACLKPRAPFFAAVKLGVGEETDTCGRFNCYYTEVEWAEKLKESGFVLGELQVDTEFRWLPDGTCQEISWLSSLALAG